MDVNPTKEKKTEEMDGSTEGLTRAAVIHVSKIHSVAKKSKNLKGTFSKALKDSAEAMSNIVERLAGRTANDEVHTLKAANQRLQGEVSDLRNELAEVRRKMDSLADPWKRNRSSVHPERSRRCKASATYAEDEMEVDQFPPLATSTP